MNIAARLQQAVAGNASKIVLTRDNEALSGAALDARSATIQPVTQD